MNYTDTNKETKVSLVSNGDGRNYSPFVMSREEVRASLEAQRFRYNWTMRTIENMPTLIPLRKGGIQ